MSIKPTNISNAVPHEGCQKCENPTCKGNCKELLTSFGFKAQAIDLGHISTLKQTLDAFDYRTKIVDAKKKLIDTLNMFPYRQAPAEILRELCNQIVYVADMIEEYEKQLTNEDVVSFESPEALFLFDLPPQNDIFQNPSPQLLQKQYSKYHQICVNIFANIEHNIRKLSGKNIKYIARQLSLTIDKMENIIIIKSIQESAQHPKQ